ncbi:CRISPR-associated CARF protein Csx1 [Pyrococcus sp. ST04]|uniref:CRISPR-associated CARF protein Csx1 n=1 Tax=Pyrococcus sp. ST04 TaxID=1183377 RepID=UPI000260591A|nr:CRISPR-associated CARF protein Csx1 [Pyrococcus sp. ST04]AFK21707.1 putative CRISPR-associated protein, MJ1666 family [Pyrococcus sp. ST04]
MKLLLASWGNFESWDEVTYKFGRTEVRSKSPISALIEEINPDKVVIILPDTLSKDFSSLKSLRETVKKKAAEFLDGLGIKNHEILIVPGVGKFRNGEFLGDPIDVYHYVVYLLQEVIPAVEDVEVHFDITHGLNYITILTYKALRDILGVVALTNNVRLITYNSEPYVKGVTKELEIHTIENEVISPAPLNRRVSGNPPVDRFSISGEELGKIKRSLENFERIKRGLNKINSWIFSLVYGLPLVLASFYPSLSEVKGAVEEAVEVYERNIFVDQENRRVVRRLRLSDNFGTLALLLLQLKVLDEPLRKKFSLPREELSVGELMEIAETVFRGRILHSTKNELNRIIERLKDNKPSDWTSLSKFLKNPSPQVNPRNFLAHAGLEANLVEVKVEDDVMVRYTKEKVFYGGSKVRVETAIGRILKVE